MIVGFGSTAVAVVAVAVAIAGYPAAELYWLLRVERLAANKEHTHLSLEWKYPSVWGWHRLKSAYGHALLVIVELAEEDPLV